MLSSIAAKWLADAPSELGRGYNICGCKLVLRFKLGICRCQTETREMWSEGNDSGKFSRFEKSGRA